MLITAFGFIAQHYLPTTGNWVILRIVQPYGIKVISSSGKVSRPYVILHGIDLSSRSLQSGYFTLVHSQGYNSFRWPVAPFFWRMSISFNCGLIAPKGSTTYGFGRRGAIDDIASSRRYILGRLGIGAL